MTGRKAGVRWQVFTGSHFEVGKQLGEYWVTRIGALADDPYGAAFLKRYPYPEWLTSLWREEHEPLLNYFLRHFPELTEEISGMVHGVNSAGLRTTFPTMFGLALGEADEEIFGCSTIAARTDAGAVLAHNEEDDWRFPLCFARVRITEGAKQREFLSASHPFQLFGSSTGATASFAFTGNSIGMSEKQTATIRSNLFSRTPKTVLSRMMLEQEDVSGVEAILSGHHSVLPNHWFVADETTTYSIQIRPVSRVSSSNSAAAQVRFAPVKEDISYHTNHFLSGRRTGDRWSWGKGAYEESEQRLKRLQRLASKNGDTSEDALVAVLAALREKTNQGRRSTTATISFSVRRGQVTGKAVSYFGGTAESVGSETIVL